MRAWVIAVSVVISSWNVQSPLLFRCSCFIRSHLHTILSAAHFSVPSCSSLSYLILYHSSFLFWKTMASLSLAPSHPSYSRPTRLYVFFLTSLLFFPIFQPRLFPPSFGVTLAHHPAHLPSPPFLPTLAILLSLRYVPRHARIHLPFPLPSSLFRVCNRLHFLTSSISCWPCIHPDIIGYLKWADLLHLRSPAVMEHVHEISVDLLSPQAVKPKL